MRIRAQSCLWMDAAQPRGVPEHLADGPLETPPDFTSAVLLSARVALLRLARAYAAVAPVGFHFSHLTAAQLYGIPLPDSLTYSSTLDVSVAVASAQPRGRGVCGHRVATPTGRVVDGLPVAEPEEVWLQLASMLSLDDLVVAGDHLVRRKRPLSTLAKLQQAVRESSGMRGNKRARAALRDVRAGTDSPKETRLRLVLVRAKLPEPVVHYVVHDADGFWVGTPDLAYVRARIAIEYEGEDHQTNRETYLSDIRRREMFERAGWKVVLVTNPDLAASWQIVARVDELLRERTP